MVAPSFNSSYFENKMASVDDVAHAHCTRLLVDLNAMCPCFIVYIDVLTNGYDERIMGMIVHQHQEPLLLISLDRGLPNIQQNVYDRQHVNPVRLEDLLSKSP